MSQPLNCLILGASYGSLLASKIALAGHNVTMVCTAPGAKLVNAEGTRVRLPVKALGKAIELDSRNLSGGVRACTPGDCDPSDFDLAILAMQEPQYGADGVRQLMGRIAAAKTPTMSVMNMPPPPFLRRIPGVDLEAVNSAFGAPEVWAAFDPERFTLASPDPQAFRPPEEGKNVLEVGLPTNVKVAPFGHETDTQILRRLQADIEAVRYDVDGQSTELPVKIKVHDSLYVPLAKWCMLLTGNYRCVLDGEVQSIRDAVHGDIDASLAVYDWVHNLCVSIGADSTDLVPFEKYARAAQSLRKPSSAARALMAGVPNIERVDRVVQAIARANGMQLDAVDAIVERVDAWLVRNQAQAAA